MRVANMTPKISDVEIGKRPLAREQVYLCIMTNVDTPSNTGLSRDALMNDHKSYLAALERKGVLFGAGRLINADEEEQTSLGHGMIIIRAKSRVEAEEIAFGEPFTKAGHRTMELPFDKHWVYRLAAIDRFGDPVYMDPPG